MDYNTKHTLYLVPIEWRQMYLFKWGITDMIKTDIFMIVFAMGMFVAIRLSGDPELQGVEYFIAATFGFVILMSIPCIALYKWQYQVWREVLHARYNGTTPRHTPIITHTAYTPN